MRSTQPNKSKRINNEQFFSINGKAGTEFFIGIVRGFVDKDSVFLKELDGQNAKTNFFDNRHTVLVTPLDSPYSEAIVESHFCNTSHHMDVPVENEAVLCMKTQAGNIILDRLSIYSYGVNEDNQIYLLSKFGTQTTKINTDYNSFKQERVERVLPWFYKKGCTYTIGRNNQYIVFDAGFRQNAPESEKEKTTDGKFIKVGFKKPNASEDSANDPSSVLISQDASIFDLFKTKFKSQQFNEQEQATDGVGIQTDDVLFIGRNLVVFYSLNKLYIKGKQVFIEADSLLELQANRIDLGRGADKKAVSGDDLIQALSDIHLILQSMSTGSLVSPAGNVIATPDLISRITQLNAKYQFSSKNSSPLLSQKIYISK
jgi:3D (Asp-Asp-Asp) domain-containing protein